MPSKRSSTGKHPNENQIATYVEGGGSDTFREAVRKHLSACADCQTIAEHVKSRAHETVVPQDSVQDSSAEIVDLPPALREHSQYEVIREIGKGGMGVVYLVRHRLTGRYESLKILLPSLVARTDLRKRFMREIQAAASLDHRYICRTLTAFEEGDVLGLVMEYVPGQDLATFVRRKGVLSSQLASQLGIQVCEALEYAQSLGMVHRDIKPANLMIDTEGEELKLKVLDFGLAKGASELDEKHSNLTRDGRLLGTPEYMSPEQAISPSKADIRSDLYSLGCTLYFMLSGRPPFEADNIYSVVNSHLVDDVIPLVNLNPQVSDSLWKVIKQLLAKDVHNRFQRPQQVIEQLRPFCSAKQPIQALLKELRETKRQPGNNPQKAAPRQIAKPLLPQKPLSARLRDNRKPDKVRRRKSGLSLVSMAMYFIPPLVSAGIIYVAREPLMHAMGLLNRNGTIVLQSMPNDIEVLIDDRPAKFSRPTAASDAQIPAEPGRYKLTLRRGGRVLHEREITIEAGRELRLSADDSLWQVQPPDKTQPKPLSDDGEGNGTTTSSGSSGSPSEPIGTQRTEFSLTDTEVEDIMAQAESALLARDGEGAISALSDLYASADQHRLPDDHSQFPPVQALHQAATSLREYDLAVSMALTRLEAGEELNFGGEQISVIDASREHLSIRRKGANHRYERRELPSQIEQALADLALTVDRPETRLAKAIGLVTHPHLSTTGASLVHSWVNDAVQADLVPEEFLLTLEELEKKRTPLLPDEPPAPVDDNSSGQSAAVGDTHQVSRRLDGKLGALGNLFLLPSDVPIRGQTSLMGASRNFKGAGSTLVKFWNSRTGAAVPADVLNGPMWMVACSTNRSVLATYGYSSQRTCLRVYYPPVVNPVFQTQDFTDERAAIALSTDGRSLAGCSIDETFVKWNLPNRSETARLVAQNPVKKENIETLTIRPSMDIVAVAATDGSIRFWHTSDGRELAQVDADSRSQVLLMRFNRRGNRLMVVRANGDIELRDIGPEFALTKKIHGHDVAVCVTSYSLNDRYVITGDGQNNVRVWDTTDLELVASLRDSNDSTISALAVDQNAEFIAVGFEDSSINLWEKK